jgi:type II secretory pathway component PulK
MRSVTEKGSTLLLATWILLIMGIVAAFLIYRSEAEWASVLNIERDFQVRRLAEMTLNRYLAQFLADDSVEDSLKDPWFHETGRVKSEEDGCQITVLIEDEGSKPNLNLLSQSGLTELLPKDLEEPIPLEPVFDWIDPDQEARGAEGAEIDYYQSLDPPYQPRDGFFSSLQELLAVKNGKALYPYLAPEVTVYGRINFNTLTKEKFITLLLSSGFDLKNDNVEEMAEEIFGANTKPTSHFDDFDAFFNSLSSGLMTIRDRMKPLFVFSGGCNANFVSEAGLRAIFKTIGLDTQDVKRIVAHREIEPFSSLSEVSGCIKPSNSGFLVQDYFTVVSTILRYRIWVKKAEHHCYLDTIQERVPGEGRVKWKAHTLAWQIITNPAEIPEIPPEPKSETAKEEETQIGY